MSAKEFRILLSLSDQNFQKRVVHILKNVYTVSSAATVKEFSDQIHKADYDLIILDYRFEEQRAEDIYQGVELLHPNAVFVIYTDCDKRSLAKKLWKRRAIDYINHTKDPYRFVQSVNKAMRWTIQKRDTVSLQKTLKNIERLVQDVKTIVSRWK